MHPIFRIQGFFFGSHWLVVAKQRFTGNPSPAGRPDQAASPSYYNTQTTHSNFSTFCRSGPSMKNLPTIEMRIEMHESTQECFKSYGF